jgi:hypothetical protein
MVFFLVSLQGKRQHAIFRATVLWAAMTTRQCQETLSARLATWFAIAA